ncbi:hypothetical protein, partial [Pectinatus frisingensis]|uniref:hypothetical protein n=1 Tax=Pectinatus frisingensis TaxID=865 RepID=UPI001E643DC0
CWILYIIGLSELREGVIYLHYTMLDSIPSVRKLIVYDQVNLHYTMLDSILEKKRLFPASWAHLHYTMLDSILI